jgi:nucleoside-triphosphatase THEP1
MAFVTFICGKVNSGKTKTLLEWVDTLKPGSVDGYACVKRIDKDQRLMGYDLMRITDKQTIEALCIKTVDHHYQDFFLYGPFVFSKDAFYQAEKILESALTNPKIETLVMDEIGQVEILGLGYARILKEALKTQKHLILCVNENHLKNVIRHFKIKEEDIQEIKHLSS